jgi:DNA invertase Pin-like site-specific DNA recombinase
MKRKDRNFGGRLRPKEEEPSSWADLVKLPNERMAFIYKRLSSHEQVKKSIYSIKAQNALYDLAREDGYPDELIYIGERDLGISGTLGREDRPELAYLIESVEAGKVEAVYTVHISRLYRDQTLINALALGEVFKEHNVIIVTLQMRLNLRDKMHVRLYRMEVERAADELELMAGRLLGARDLKAKSGFYAGEKLPAGYVVDERQTLPSGEPNPAYHVYQIFEPHAQVVRTILERMAMPGMTPTRVARFCDRQGIVFPPFPPEFETPANLKALVNSHPNLDGSWPVTIDRVRGIATNPAYIGWKIWSGEVIAKDVYPPIVSEQVFWTAQSKFGRESRPKRERTPLPLAGLLYCGNHPVPQRMTYVNKSPSYHALYRCCAHRLRKICANITAYFLDDPISEAIISQLTLGSLSERTLQKYADEYEAANKPDS